MPKPSSPKISLIVATIHRQKELLRLLESLTHQDEKNFEVIIVDQNKDHLIVPMINQFSNQLNITHIRTPPGLAKARNEGLKIAQGTWICFPDDDCWYGSKTLSNAMRFCAQLKNNEIGISGVCIDAHEQLSVNRWILKTTQKNHFYFAWRQCASISLVLKKESLQVIKGFNESLGLGSHTPYQSGEETDCIIRLLKQGYNIKFVPQHRVYHPQVIETYTPQSYQRALSYGQGLGRVMALHQLSFFQYFDVFYRPLGGIFLYGLSGQFHKSKFSFYVLQGRIRGFLSKC